jgi:hypothetical protein
MRLLLALFVAGVTAVSAQKTSRQEQNLFSGEKITDSPAHLTRYDVSIESELQIKLGSEHGIGLTSPANAVSDESLAVIIQGVEQGNAENTYFF